MSDEGHDATEEILSELEKRLNEAYAEAEKEVADTLADYMAKFQKKDAIKREAAQNGLITWQEYVEWRYGQLVMSDRWQRMLDTLALELTKTNQIAKEIAYGTMPEIYTLNFNYGTYQLEHTSGINTMFTLYNKDAVALLFKDDDKLYHDCGLRLSKKIAVQKDLAWNKRQIQSIMTQSILQGESIPNIATRLQNNASQPFDASDIKDADKKTAQEVAKEVTEKNRKAAIRNARTMTTYVENKGRENSYKRGEAMGLDVLKEWRATYDNRTRHEHRVLNLQKVPIDEPFYYGDDPIYEPADPTAKGYLIYNCRCRLAVHYVGFERKKGYDTYYDEELMGMSYDDWLKAKPTSQSITHQEDVGKAIANSYRAEYRRIKNANTQRRNKSKK